jgi:predicted nucleic acid-binding protein
VGERVAVVDTSCLIGLSGVQLTSLPRLLYADVIVPPAVQSEFGELPTGYTVREPRDQTLVQSLRLLLGRGESEVITLGIEIAQSGSQIEVILDDLHARQVAANFGLAVVGTVGLLVRAKLGGHIASVRSVLGQMREAGFYCSTELFHKALRLAGEED